MKISNPGRNHEVSDVLSFASQILRGKGVVVTQAECADGTKGTLILELVIGLATGVIGSTIYDAIKVAAQRISSSRSPDHLIIDIDGKKYTLQELKSKKSDES